MTTRQRLLNALLAFLIALAGGGAVVATDVLVDSKVVTNDAPVQGK